MKKIFYKNLFRELNLNKETYLVTVINGMHNGKSIIGQKLFKGKKNIFIENDEFEDFWNSVLKEIDFNKGSYILKLENNISLFTEYILGKPSLVICGGGHIALPLCKMAKILEFDVTVIDDREEFANEERFKEADNVICEGFNEIFNKFNFNNNMYFVIVTRGHKDDRRCLEIILKNEFAYVGMIGSRSKVAFVTNNMIKNGYTKEEISKAHAPIGLKIGAQTPEEISISILGEIIKVKNEKSFIHVDYDILNKICNKEDHAVLAKIIEKRGSGPRGAGSQMIVLKNKDFIGTVGGGSVENAVYNKALELFETKESIIEEYDLSNSESAKLGMACGGSVKVLFEYI